MSTWYNINVHICLSAIIFKAFLAGSHSLALNVSLVTHKRRKMIVDMLAQRIHYSTMCVYYYVRHSWLFCMSTVCWRLLSRLISELLSLLLTCKVVWINTSIPVQLSRNISCECSFLLDVSCQSLFIMEMLFILVAYLVCYNFFMGGRAILANVIWLLWRFWYMCTVRTRMYRLSCRYFGFTLIHLAIYHFPTSTLHDTI